MNTAALFIRGGAEILVDDLMLQLQKRGHVVDLYRLPFADDFEMPLVRLIASSQMLRFDDYDRVIAFKFPAYCVIHRNKVVWMFHQFRQVYELWGTEYGFPNESRYYPERELIRHADETLRHTRHTFTNAQEVARRLMRYNSIDSQVLPPPLENVEKYKCGQTGDYLFYPSRVDPLKRQHLAIEAMRYVQTDVKLIVAGACGIPEYDHQLCETIKKYKLEEKVRYENRWISNDEKYEWRATCLGSMYLAYKEDSCGFVSMEAFYCAKPVITCVDSGGTAELIDDGKTGFFCEPTPQSIAEAMDRFYADRIRTAEMGLAARAEILRRDITWDHTIRRLLA